MADEPKIREVLHDRLVIYLDVLGFSQACSMNAWATQKGPNDAVGMYKEFVEAGTISKELSKDIWEKVFLLSDCLFLTSQNCDEGLEALLHLVAYIFEYSPRYGIPTLVRGGIGYGDLIYDLGISPRHGGSAPILKGKQPSDLVIGNVYGPAVVEAVEHEKKGKGPRLFAPKEIINKVKDSAIKNIIVPSIRTDDECSELLWGAYHAVLIDGLQGAKNIFETSLKAYETSSTLPGRHRDHYVEGVCLTIRCISNLCKQCQHPNAKGFEGLLNEFIQPKIKRIIHMQDFVKVDEVIRWEQARHHHV